MWIFDKINRNWKTPRLSMINAKHEPSVYFRSGR